MPSFPRQAIVLAAGFGTRLMPLTRRVPKPALPVAGVPIIFYNLFLLKQAGVREVTINLHHLPNIIRDLFKNSRRLGLKLHFSLEPKILGTAGGIAQALAAMPRRRTWVVNGDVLSDLDLKAMARLHEASQAAATLACVMPHQAKVQSFVEADARHRIWRIAGAPPLDRPHPQLSRFIFSGIQLLEPRLFAKYPEGSFGCVVRQIYQPALAASERLSAYLHRGLWWDLGSLTELKRVDEMLWKDEAGDKMRSLTQEVRRWAHYSTARKGLTPARLKTIT